MQGKCNICFLTGVNLYNMTSTELNYYQQFVFKVELSSHTKVICVYCKSMLKRINKFAEKCQKSQDFLMDTIKLESDMIMQLKNSHNLSPCTITYLHVGPTESASVKKENDSEDDIPLVLLSQNGNSSEFLDDSDDHNAEPKEDFNEKENKIGHMKVKKNKSKKGSHLKEGFSSRMVQETDEYIVIKLTKEQVLAEMQENKMAEKYKMAPYKCEKCVKGFNFDDVLQAHMEKHLPKNGQFICDICTQHCPSAVSLRGHLKSHTTRYKCKVCQIVRLSRQHVLEHFALEHTDSAVSYRCTQCPYTSKKRTVMQRHVRLHSSSEPHACHQCGKLYKSRESLRVHIMRHDNSKRHQCDVCSRWFIYATQLKKHMQAVHVRRDYYCVECDVKFKSMYTLKQHFQRAKKHRDASSYKFSCSSCPLRFVSGAALATHDTRAHGAAARAACGLCERRYSCGEALRLHERRAHAPRPPPAPAPCPLCHRTFSRKSVLRIHMRTHTGDRPHACECGASYAQPAALRAHRAAKHKNEIANVLEGS